MSTTILAFDLGRKCGWADNAHGLECGTETLQDEKHALEFFREYIRDTRPDAVLYEDVMRHVGTHAAHRYGGYLALLRCACQEAGVMLHGVGVGEIKKHATGNGKAVKDDMIRAARRLGLEPVDDNAADAACLLQMAVDTGMVIKGEEWQIEEAGRRG